MLMQDLTNRLDKTKDTRRNLDKRTARLRNDTGGVEACTSDGPGIAGRWRSDASQGPLRRHASDSGNEPCSVQCPWQKISSKER